MSKVELAVSCMKEGFHCAQAILSTFGVGYGLDRDTALRVSGGFGGGMGGLAETCGAVTGAFMVIGLKYASTKAGDKKAKRSTERQIQDFYLKFKSRNRSVVCRDLLGCDISTQEGRKLALDKKLFFTDCPKFVRDAAEILEDML